LTYYRDFAAQHEDDPTLRAGLARSFYRVGRITSEIGSTQEALAAHEKARDLWLRLVADNPEDRDYPKELARTYHDIGLLLASKWARPADGLRALQEAEPIYDRLAREHRDVIAYQKGLASCYDSLARWYDMNSRPDEARSYFEKSIALW